MGMPKVKNTEIPTNSGGSAKSLGGLTVNSQDYPNNVC